MSEGSILNTAEPVVIPTMTTKPVVKSTKPAKSIVQTTPPKTVVLQTTPSKPIGVPTIQPTQTVVPTLSSTPIVVPTIQTIATPSAHTSIQNQQTTMIQPSATITTENLNESGTSLSSGGDSVLVQHYLLTSIVTNTSTGKQTSQLITQPIILPDSDTTTNQNMVLVPNIQVPVGIVPLSVPSGTTTVENTPAIAGDASTGIPVEMLLTNNDAISTQTGVPVAVASNNMSGMVSSSNPVLSNQSGKGKAPVRKNVKMSGKMSKNSANDSGFTGEYVLLDDNQILVPDGSQNQTILDSSSNGQGQCNQTILGQGQPNQTTVDVSCPMSSDGMQDGKIINVISLTDLLTPIDIANFNDANSVDKDDIADQTVDVRDFLSEAVSKELSDALGNSSSGLPLIENE